MPPFLYRWPKTGDTVQAWVDDEPDDDDFTHVHVPCVRAGASSQPKDGQGAR